MYRCYEMQVFISPISFLTHRSGLCACVQCAKSNTQGRGPRGQHSRLKPALKFEKGMCAGNYTNHFEVLQLKLGSLLGSFTYNYEGTSREVFSSTKCSETFQEKSLRSVVLNLSLIFPQGTNVLTDFVYQIAC